MGGDFLESVVFTDVEDAKRLIKENMKGFFKLFNSSPAGICMTTMDRVFVRVNRKFEDNFGYTQEEVLGRTSMEINMLDEDEWMRVSAIFREKGKIENIIVRCRKKNGDDIYVVSSTEILELNGEKYMLSSFLDITTVVKQEKIIERQNKEIIDSIYYARLIQNSVLPNQTQIEAILPESFVLSKPKDILSGDFYWIKQHGEKIFVSACDCTGHGVPAALISIIGFQLLNKFIDEYQFSQPAEILNQLNRELAVNKTQFNDVLEEIKDGMDIALCLIDKAQMTIDYSGAYNPIYLVRNGELIKLEADKIPIHLFTSDTGREFNNYQIKIEENDVVYLFSDGYADQFGGPNGKKFRYKHFQELILEIHTFPMALQKHIFDRTIENWKSSNGDEQTDDILIVGFRISANRSVKLD